MTAELPSSGGGRLARLRATFIASLAERLAEAQSLADALKKPPVDPVTVEALHTVFHNLKGVANVFGLGDIGAVAVQGEQLLDTHQQQSTLGDETFTTALAECLKTLEERSARARDSQANDAAAAASPGSAGAVADAEAPVRTGGPRIVIVDDESLMRSVLKTLLQSAGHVVVGEASNGVAALELCVKQQPDLVLLDINMPGVDGLRVLRAIRKEFPAIKVIMVSAHGSIDKVSSAISAGAVGFVVKPFNAANVLKQIERFFKPEETQNRHSARVIP
jgi:two-component system, chemotaxis family, chemotaxis protein CheY